MIIPNLSDMINDHNTSMKLKDNKTQSGEWKIQLTMHVNFISSEGSGGICKIYVWSGNKKFFMINETDDIIKELFRTFFNNYLKEVQIMRGRSDFIFERFDLLEYDLNRISLKRGGSYIKSPERLENKRATINPQNNYVFSML